MADQGVKGCVGLLLEYASTDPVFGINDHP